MKQKLKLIVVAVFVAVSGLVFTSAQAATIVPISGITGFSGGDSFTPGDFSQLTNGTGITKPDANDPSTWTNTGTGYQEEWYDNFLVGATNSKLGWVSFDLGTATTDLDELFIFNSNYNGGSALGASDINVYYATTPTVALPAPPGQNGAVDYDFASGGWTSLTSVTMTAASTEVIDLSSIASARYIAVEIMDDLSNDDRVGFDEVAITAIPEPSTALLAALGLLALLRRRR